MTKRLCLALLVFVCTLVLYACTAIDEDTYPQVRICPTNLRTDNLYIALRDDHQFSRTNPYNEIETEQGYDIIIHVRRNENE